MQTCSHLTRETLIRVRGVGGEGEEEEEDGEKDVEKVSEAYNVLGPAKLKHFAATTRREN